MWRGVSCALMMSAFLLGCASKPSVKPSASARQGAYYKDDGPPDSVNADLDRVADAVPRDEPLHRFANRPYNVFGVNYTPMMLLQPFSQRGTASWYGKKFHGQKTAIGETYDMFAMSAAHPTAPLPSFARVTGVKSGRSVIVRVNDRGPFHAERIVDLSYAAAHRIGIAQIGSGEVVFELLTPSQFASARSSTVSSLPTSSSASSPSAAPSLKPDVVVSANTAAPTTAQFNRASPQFFIQLGAFGNFANAQAFQGRVSTELGISPLVKQVGALFRVQIGPYFTEQDAQQARALAQQRLNISGSPLPLLTENATP